MFETSKFPAQLSLIGSADDEAGLAGRLDAATLGGAKAVFLAGSPDSTRTVLALEIETPLIDLTYAAEESPRARLRAPMVEPARHSVPADAVHVIASPAAIALALILNRLHPLHPIQRAVAHVFEPASERGKPGLDELQQQTVNLLSFKGQPKAIYDAQLAFNMLARYGESAPESLEDFELRIERHLATLLSASSRAPIPSIRLIQAPVFHGHSISLWVEFEENPGVAEVELALNGEHLDVRRDDQEPPNIIGITGQEGIAVGAVTLDRNHPQACWIWAAADNLRLMASNARGGGAAAAMTVRYAIAAMACLMLTSCGYHVSGKADLLPKRIQTIAIPAFGNATKNYKLSERMTGALTREFIARTRYRIVADPNQAEAILTGAVINSLSYATVYDPATNRASGAQVIVILQVTLTDRSNGAVLFTRPNFEVRERYEISVDARTYFEESDAAMERLSRDVARSVVSAVLENF